MPSALRVGDIRAALDARLFPSITIWNRLEGRPRTPQLRPRAARRGPRRAVDADQAVADGRVPRQRRRLAGVREAAGRHHAADQVPARPAQAAQPFDDRRPARGEGRAAAGCRWQPAGRPIALDLRLVMGAQWLALIAGIGDYRAGVHRRRTRSPRPTRRKRATQTVCAQPEVWQLFAAVAGPGDGRRRAATSYLARGPGAPRLRRRRRDRRGRPRCARRLGRSAFVAWFERLPARSPPRGDDAWVPPQLEYQFAASAPLRPDGGEKVYVADEYYAGPARLVQPRRRSGRRVAGPGRRLRPDRPAARRAASR